MNYRSRRNLTYLPAVAVATALVAAAAVLAWGGGEKGTPRIRSHALRALAAAQPEPQRLKTRTLPRREPRRAEAGYPDAPVATAGAAQAVARFMPGFLAWSLGRAPATAIKNTTAAFIAQARAHPPNVTPAERQEQLRVVRIRVLAGNPPVVVVDLAPAGGVSYQLDFYLARSGRRWLVTGLAPGG